MYLSQLYWIICCFVKVGNSGQTFGDNACHSERSEESLRPSSQILRYAQNDTTPGCHSERSEESLRPSSQILRCAQNDTTPGCHSERSEESLADL